MKNSTTIVGLQCTIRSFLFLLFSCCKLNYFNILFPEYDIYPTQFSLLSKNHPLGTFVRRRDTVFVEVVSAIERTSFWGKPATHLLSHKNSMVTVEEKTPVPHRQISGMCIHYSCKKTQVIAMVNDISQFAKKSLKY